jgi:fructose-bisphosphate aldolase class 1
MTEEENKNQDSRIREFMYNNAIIADYMNGVITYQNALSRITENGIDSLE